MAIGSNLRINHRRPYETGHLPPQLILDAGIPPSLDPFPRLGSRWKRGEKKKKKREKNKESIDRKFENFFRSIN